MNSLLTVLIMFIGGALLLILFLVILIRLLENVESGGGQGQKKYNEKIRYSSAMGQHKKSYKEIQKKISGGEILYKGKKMKGGKKNEK